MNPLEGLAQYLDRLEHRLRVFAWTRGAAAVAPVEGGFGYCTEFLIEGTALDVGLLRPGDPADFIEVTSAREPRVLRTWIDGRLVAEQGQTRIERKFSVSGGRDRDVKTPLDRAARTAQVDKLFASYDKPGSPGCAVAVIQAVYHSAALGILMTCATAWLQAGLGPGAGSV